MLIEEKPLTHWVDHFYGYGSWQATCWFIGYEESGGDFPEEVAEKLTYFYRAHSTNRATLCDIRELYRQVTARMEGTKADLFTSLYDYRFGNQAVQHNVWKNLILFEHGCTGEQLPDLLSYQKNLFALPTTGREAWIKLYPLPSTHNHAWYYSWLDLPKIDFLRTRTVYEQRVYTNRINTILSNIKTYKPSVVVMYGMNNITALKQSVQESFEGVTFKMIKAIKLQIPQHHRAHINGTTLVITTQVPTLRHNRIESGFDWQAFGEVVSEK
ncbi:MAG: hypothetical protein JNM78_12960 [Cyclobacteriaceae bacterium]|nr:hypothetical protein [Cyclobacteriaceae bacterium]